jgi:hypothetical protein
MQKETAKEGKEKKNNLKNAKKKGKWITGLMNRWRKLKTTQNFLKNRKNVIGKKRDHEVYNPATSL